MYSHTRRHFLQQQSFSLAGLALCSLLRQDGLLAAPAKPSLERPVYNVLPKSPPRPARANAMISLFMQGGPSHLDLFDPKPELVKRHLQTFTGQVQIDNAAEASSKLYASPWKFTPCGQSGTEFSELLPHTGAIADDITLIRSMRTSVNNHGQSLMALHTGQNNSGHPTLGAWLTYGLGSENQNLPAYVVLTDQGGLPVMGTELWANGYLPSLYQGTVIRPKEPRILNLDPPAHLAGASQDRLLGLIRRFNERHQEQHPTETDLSARIASYELAARMQTAAREALDLSQETEATFKLYGLDQPETRGWGERCLLARRLVERGVRFVQLYSTTQGWDHHGGLTTALPAACKAVDQPCAALVTDLKQRGLLDTTVVHWGGEMGRLPLVQNEANIGRDHNTFGFSSWFAGGGFQAGLAYGATDELGHHAVENVVMHTDYHRTLLHLFGFEPTQLTFARPNGTLALVAPEAGKIVTDVLDAAATHGL